MTGLEGVLHAALWCAGALLLADWRLGALVGRG